MSKAVENTENTIKNEEVMDNTAAAVPAPVDPSEGEKKPGFFKRMKESKAAQITIKVGSYIATFVGGMVVGNTLAKAADAGSTESDDNYSYENSDSTDDVTNTEF